VVVTTEILAEKNNALSIGINTLKLKSWDVTQGDFQIVSGKCTVDFVELTVPEAKRLVKKLQTTLKEIEGINGTKH
jgi:hypothetical protein